MRIAGDTEQTTICLEFEKNNLLPQLYGEHNNYLQYLEKNLDVLIQSRGNLISIQGEKNKAQFTQKVLNKLYHQLEKHRDITLAEIEATIRLMESKKLQNGSAKTEENCLKTSKKLVRPRSIVQEKYIEQILANDLTFGIGPAGTGKTYLAVAVGVTMLTEGKVDRLILSRPAVEAGEHLGFLPGDMREKVDPYLRPIYDALHDMLPQAQVAKYIEKGEIEIAPLAFMRGRTLSNAFIILDEAQNTTPVQMKMFLTRLGEYSRMVVTGDLTQIDLPKGVPSGLTQAIKTLELVEGIGFTHFRDKDVVRHPLVSKIVKAYDDHISN